MALDSQYIISSLEYKAYIAAKYSLGLNKRAPSGLRVNPRLIVAKRRHGIELFNRRACPPRQAARDVKSGNFLTPDAGRNIFGRMKTNRIKVWTCACVIQRCEIVSQSHDRPKHFSLPGAREDRRRWNGRGV